MTCAHGYSTPAACIDCMDDDGLGAVPVPPETIERTIRAQFDSQCNECNFPIRKSDWISQTNRGRWIHTRCA